MVDLFMTQEEKLTELIKRFDYIKTSQITKMAYDHQIYCSDPTRIARRIAQKGILRRLSYTEKIRRGFQTKEGVYEVISR